MQDDESRPEQASRVAAVKSFNWHRTVIAMVITAVFAGTGGYLLGTRTHSIDPPNQLRGSAQIPTVTQSPTVVQSFPTSEAPYYQFDEIDTIVRARKDLANRLNVHPLSIEIIVLEKIIWPDTCIGAPKQTNCGRKVDVPGYKVVFEALDKKYEYHTGGEYHRSIDL